VLRGDDLVLDLTPRLDARRGDTTPPATIVEPPASRDVSKYRSRTVSFVDAAVSLKIFRAPPRAAARGASVRWSFNRPGVQRGFASKEETQ